MPSPAPRHSCQPSGQLFRRLHRCIAEGSHLLSRSLPDLNTELREDERFKFTPFATSSQFSYSLQLHACFKTDCYGATTALAIPMNILQPTPVPEERTAAVLENNPCAHHPASKASQPLPVSAEGSAHQD